MGSACSSQEVRTQVERANEIDKEIQKNRIKELQTMKLLLLGAGECGKSTVLKQMQ